MFVKLNKRISNTESKHERSRFAFQRSSLQFRTVQLGSGIKAACSEELYGWILIASWFLPEFRWGDLWDSWELVRALWPYQCNGFMLLKSTLFLVDGYQNDEMNLEQEMTRRGPFPTTSCQVCNSLSCQTKLLLLSCYTCIGLCSINPGSSVFWTGILGNSQLVKVFSDLWAQGQNNF